MGIFDKKNVQSALVDASKKKGNSITIPDVYVCKFAKIEQKKAKSGNEMIVVTSSIEDYDDLNSYFVFIKEKPEQALKIVGFFYNAFGHDFEPIDAMTSKEEAEEVMKQLEQYIGKEFQAAVTVKEDLFEPKEKLGTYIKTMKAEIWYTGALGIKLKLNKQKAFTSLSGEKLLIWNKYQASKPTYESSTQPSDTQMQDQDANRKKVANDSFAKTEEEKAAAPDDDLPFAVFAILGISQLLSISLF